MALRNTLGHFESVVLRVVHDFVPSAVRALLPNDRSAPAALVARHLRLRDHAGHDLLADDAHALAVARAARVQVRRGRGAGAAAVVAEDALLDHEVDARARVRVRERDLELAHGGRPAAGLLRVPAAAPEEVLEHVEGVGMVRAAAFVCLEPFLTMAVVDLPFGGVREDLVGLRSIRAGIYERLYTITYRGRSRRTSLLRRVLYSCLGDISD